MTTATQINSCNPGVEIVLLTTPDAYAYTSTKFMNVGAVDYTFNGAALHTDGYIFSVSGGTVTVTLIDGAVAADIWLYLYPAK